MKSEKLTTDTTDKEKLELRLKDIRRLRAESHKIIAKARGRRLEAITKS